MAFAVFLAVIPVGSALGYIVGGLADRYLGWRSAFFVAGVPGLVLAAVVLRLYEPPRGAQDGPAPAPPSPLSIPAAYAAPARHRAYVLTGLGYSSHTFGHRALAVLTSAVTQPAP